MAGHPVPAPFLPPHPGLWDELSPEEDRASLLSSCSSYTQETGSQSVGTRSSPPPPTRAPLSGCPSLWDPRLGEGPPAYTSQWQPVWAPASQGKCGPEGGGGGSAHNAWKRQDRGGPGTSAQLCSHQNHQPDARAAEEIRKETGARGWGGCGAQERPAATPAQVCIKQGLGLVSWGPGPRWDKRKGSGFPCFPGNRKPLAAGEGGKPVGLHMATLKTLCLPQVGRSLSHSMPQFPHPYNGNIRIYL